MGPSLFLCPLKATGYLSPLALWLWDGTTFYFWTLSLNQLKVVLTLWGSAGLCTSPLCSSTYSLMWRQRQAWLWDEKNMTTELWSHLLVVHHVSVAPPYTKILESTSNPGTNALLLAWASPQAIKSEFLGLGMGIVSEYSTLNYSDTPISLLKVYQTKIGDSRRLICIWKMWGFCQNVNYHSGN